MDEEATGGRSMLTLAALAAIFVAGVVWAWTSVTDPYPSPLASSPCTTTQVASGERIQPAQILVSVLNASNRAGLARQTMDRLVAHGFGEGELANTAASAATAPAVVWASPDDPAARLVASHLGNNVEVRDQPSSYPGITIVVGEAFPGVTKGMAGITTDDDTRVCSPN